MKLRTKIAGTVALPLALAIASAANAATVVDTAEHQLKIGGFVAAQAVWNSPDVGDMDYSMNLASSRLNVEYQNKENDIRFLYEQFLGGDNTLRHAAIFHDGWVAGQTWSFFANLTGLAETVDATGTAGSSSWASRNALLGKVIPLGDGMSVGVSIEDRNLGATETAVPDITANFKGNFGGVGVFVAAQQYNTRAGATYALNTATGAIDKTPGAADDESFTRFTAGASVPMGALGLKAAFTQDDKDAALSVAGQFKVNDQLRTNLVVEQSMVDVGDDYTQLWVNAFYKLQSGWEWGAEVSTASGANGATVKEKDMRVNLQAKYAF